jgi:RHS repeat-associated protein
VAGGNSTTYNADNAQSKFNGTSHSYDANGNLLSNGANTYTWDARNYLSGISGANNASFVYDAFARRMNKTINGTVTQFLYGRLNPVQELDGANAVTANLLTGLGIDKYFARTDSSGTTAFLTDALGSTVGLVGSGGSIDTGYTYQPFGATTVTGSNANSYQCTGRENDGTGLYYYRARYYSPTFQRFIGQDPIGFAGGGANLYGYVRESPLNETDPTGLCGDRPCFGWARQLQGNLGTVGHTGAFGTAVPAEGADIDPAQWGGKGAVRAIRGGVSGVAGPWNFSGIGDVIGGPFGSPVPGMNTRQGLEALNPGLLLIELPGAPLDLGVVPVVLMLPRGVPCPVGTVPAE